MSSDLLSLAPGGFPADSRHIFSGRVPFFCSILGIATPVPSVGPEMLDYKACNLSPERMEILAEDILGEKSRPRFSSVVIQDEDITSAFRLLHKMILEQTGNPLKKKHTFSCCSPS